MSDDHTTNKPQIIPVDDRIQVQEIPQVKKIVPVITQKATQIYEVADDEDDGIPTIKPTIPPAIKDHTQPEELDTSWLNEKAAEEMLTSDPYSNPEVQIETPTNFIDVPSAHPEEIRQLPVTAEMEAEVFDRGVPDTHAAPEPIVGDTWAEVAEALRDPFVSVEAAIAASEPDVEPGTDSPLSAPIEDDWNSNVQEDTPAINPTLQPGMETMDSTEPIYSAGPVVLDDIEDTQDDTVELNSFMDHQQEEVQPDTTTTPLPDTDEVGPANENILTDNEAPVVPTYGFFHNPTKETLVPLHREELALQFAEIFPNEMTDSPQIQKLKAHAVQEPSTFPSYVARSTGFTSPEQGRITDVFKNTEGPVGGKKKIDDKVYGDAFSSKVNSRPLQTTSIVGGEKAFHTAMALISGIRRVSMYNSGFNVTIRPPLLSELHQFYMRARSASQEFGRQFGQYAFIPADIELKIAGMELFKSLILDSNLANWKESGVIEENLSIFDYDTCLWGMASLMFPEGTEVEMFCNKRNCNFVDKAKVDIVKMRFNDYSRINNDAIKFVCSSDTTKPRTTEDLKIYKSQMLNESEVLQLTDEWSISVETPSVAKYIEDGSTYVADMASRIQMRNSLDVGDYIRCKYFRIFAPWIKQISFLDKRTGHYNHWQDPIKMPDIIETLQLDKNQIPLDTKLTEYMNKKRVSYFGYLYSGCPKCKTVPDMAINGIIPCDMQQSFFTLTMDRIS